MKNINTTGANLGHREDHNENFIENLRTKSTIYRRHEKRMIKNSQSRKDPRCAPIRVLAGLPGLRDILKLPKTPIKSQGEGGDKKSLGKEQFDTIDTSTIFVVNSHLNDNSKKYIRSLTDNQSTEISVLNAFMAGCLGGILEATLGRSKTDVHNRMTKQISGLINLQSFSSPKSNGLQLYSIGGQPVSLSSAFSLPGVNAIARDRIVASGLAAGLLFSSSFYFHSVLRDNDGSGASGKMSSDNPLSSSFMLASAATGAVTATAFSPFELARSRIVLQNGAAVLSPFGLSPSSTAGVLSSRTVLAEMRSVAQRHGFRALYKGGTEVYSREIIGNMAYFSLYELVKTSLFSRDGDNTDLDRSSSSARPSALQIVASGGIAGATFWAVVYPLDTLKAMLQAQSISNPRFKTAVAAVKEVGITNLYRGYLPCIVRAAPANAALFLGYETAMSTFYH